MTMIATNEGVLWHTFTLALLTDRDTFILASPEVLLAIPWASVVTVLSGVSSCDALEDGPGWIPEASSVI
jgi:hypothetical protein